MNRASRVAVSGEGPGSSQASGPGPAVRCATSEVVRVTVITAARTPARAFSGMTWGEQAQGSAPQAGAGTRSLHACPVRQGQAGRGRGRFRSQHQLCGWAAPHTLTVAVLKPVRFVSLVPRTGTERVSPGRCDA